MRLPESVIQQDILIGEQVSLSQAVERLNNKIARLTEALSTIQLKTNETEETVDQLEDWLCDYGHRTTSYKTEVDKFIKHAELTRECIRTVEKAFAKEVEEINHELEKRDAYEYIFDVKLSEIKKEQTVIKAGLCILGIANIAVVLYKFFK